MKCGFLGLMVMCWVGLQSYAQGPGFWINRSRSADFGQARSALAYSRFSQFEGLDTLYRKVKGFGVGLPQEKAYLHLDNTCYFLGDTIWYKGSATVRLYNNSKRTAVSVEAVGVTDSGRYMQYNSVR